MNQCALANPYAMLVKFQLRQLIAVSLTSTASLEKVGWEAEGNGSYLRVRCALTERNAMSVRVRLDVPLHLSLTLTA